MMTKGIFLDRDGTIIRHVPYLSKPGEVELLQGAKEALQALINSNYLLFLFTNQSGVGRGWFLMEDVVACNERMLELLELPAPGFSEICIAPEAPDAPVVYRKPSPRFILETAKKYGLSLENCYMVGDAKSDIEAALAAKINPIVIGGLSDDRPEVQVFDDLSAFVRHLLADNLA